MNPDADALLNQHPHPPPGWADLRPDDPLAIIDACPPALRDIAADMLTTAHWRATREADDDILRTLQRQPTDTTDHGQQSSD